MLKVYCKKKSSPLKKVTRQSCVVDLLWSLWKTDKLSTVFTMSTQQNVKRSLESLAVHVFWRDIPQLDLLKSFSCDSCGDRHPTLVFDGIALGVQIKKVKSFKDKMRLVLGKRSEKKLGGIKFKDRTFIPLKKNKRFLKECVKGKVWPKDMSDLDLNQGK